MAGERLNYQWRYCVACRRFFKSGLRGQYVPVVPGSKVKAYRHGLPGKIIARCHCKCSPELRGRPRDDGFSCHVWCRARYGPRVVEFRDQELAESAFRMGGEEAQRALLRTRRECTELCVMECENGCGCHCHQRKSAV